jgi:hypothetical protein
MLANPPAGWETICLLVDKIAGILQGFLSNILVLNQ